VSSSSLFRNKGYQRSYQRVALAKNNPFDPRIHTSQGKPEIEFLLSTIPQKGQYHFEKQFYQIPQIPYPKMPQKQGVSYQNNATATITEPQKGQTKRHTKTS
jgi:hypothetical protein